MQRNLVRRCFDESWPFVARSRRVSRRQSFAEPRNASGMTAVDEARNGHSPFTRFLEHFRELVVHDELTFCEVVRTERFVLARRVAACFVAASIGKCRAVTGKLESNHVAGLASA